MALRTSVASGLWSAATTWDTGVPVDGDSFTIAAGHVVEFDADQSTFVTGMAGGTITGELKGTLAAGTRVLKMAGDLGGTGILRAGELGTPYPIGSRFHVNLNGNYKCALSSSGSYQQHPTNPTHPTISLSAPAAAGATVLSVDTDVTGDTWAIGDRIRVDNVAAGQDSEERVISAISASSITVTVGLGNAKVQGAKVHLISRNAGIYGNGGTSDHAADSAQNGYLGEIRACSAGIIYGSGNTVATVSGCIHGVYDSHANTITVVSGCTNGINNANGNTITAVSGCSNGTDSSRGNTITAVSGCNTGLNKSHANTISTVSGCNTGMNLCSGRLVGAVFSGNATDVVYLGAAMGSLLLESYRHGGVAGDYRSWTGGGYASTDPAVNLGGVDAIKLTFQDAARHARAEQEIDVRGVGRTLTIQGIVRLGATGMTLRPRVQLVAPGNDPLVAGQAALAEFLPADSTADQPFLLQYTPEAGDLRPVVVRFIGGHTSGNAWASWWRRETLGSPGVMAQARRVA